MILKATWVPVGRGAAGAVCDALPVCDPGAMAVGKPCAGAAVPGREGETGPTGPVASTRYEQMREGVQQCEARIAIATALTDEKLKAKVGPADGQVTKLMVLRFSWKN